MLISCREKLKCLCFMDWRYDLFCLDYLVEFLGWMMLEKIGKVERIGCNWKRSWLKFVRIGLYEFMVWIKLGFDLFFELFKFG